jgi:hypothetical protein
MKITETIAKLPVIGSKSTLEMVAKFGKMRSALQAVHEDTDYWREHYWIFDCTECLKL